MRSLKEIWFRANQEAGDLAMFALPPTLPWGEQPTVRPFADPAWVADSLRGTPYAAHVLALAEGLLEHRFPLLGLTIETGPDIDWRRDYANGVSTGTAYFRAVPYLDFARVGDHKVVWELNRHQHLPLLAQAFLLSGRREFLDEAFRQLEDWMDQNPFLRGINWASALEAAFRGLSWAWFWMLAGTRMPEALRRRFLIVLYRHGRFIERNLSVYFSPNTHLLGEAVSLHALGTLFPGFPHARRWTEVGGRIVREQMEAQVRPDGSHFEQSAYYHVYALDLFLLHQLIGRPPAEYTARLARMAEYLHALMGPSGLLPLVGDDDGGRLFHPFGERERFGNGTLAMSAVWFRRPEWLLPGADFDSQAAWWLGERVEEFRGCPPGAGAASRLFRDAGVAIMASGDVHIVVKAGPFGAGPAGHSHSDALSLVARVGARETLIDPGTYTYIASPEERNRFRGSMAHSTIRIDGRDQAAPAGPFRWRDKPVTAIGAWNTSPDRDSLDASCAYGGFTHRRRVLFLKRERALVALDSVDGPAGEHLLEQFWRPASLAEASRLSTSGSAEVLEGWRSRALCSREPAPVLRVAYRGPLPSHMAAVLDLSEAPSNGEVKLIAENDDVVLEWGALRIRFPRVGQPIGSCRLSAGPPEA
ncbi:MAG: alginate lyase family protein [Bryobacteraceae bacterium]